MIRRVVPAIVLAAVLAPACTSRQTPPEPAADTPESVALELFRLAAEPAALEERMGELFLIDDDLLNRARLLDAVERLDPQAPPVPVGTQVLDGQDDVVVDLEAQLAGEGQAFYSVRLERGEDGSWKVRWFVGPGVEWPASRPRRDEGLSSSAPPE